MVALGDHVQLITGFPFKSAQYTDNLEDTRLLRGDNVAQGILRWNGAKYWPRAHSGEFSKFELAVNDVVLAMDRPWIEAGLKYAWVKPRDLPCLLVQRVARLRGADALDTIFVRYLIGSKAFTEHVQSIITGVNVPHISGRDISRFQFRLPPVRVQRLIVSILGAYDGLIENNARRIAILEEMARRIFDEWFVRFRAPGCENKRFSDTALGSIPRQWSIGSLEELATLEGATINPTVSPNVEFAHYSYPAFDAGQLPLFERGEKIQSNKLQFNAGVVLMGKLNPRIPRIWLVADQEQYPMVTSTEFMPLRPHQQELLPYLFSVLSSDNFVQRLRGLTGGTSTSHQRAKAGDVMGLSMVAPPKKIALRYCEVTAPMMRLRLNLIRQVANLRTQRDLLLPELISGEIDVGHAERVVEAVE